jgi:hypothetical protein
VLQPEQRRALFAMLPRVGCPRAPRCARIAWLNGWRFANAMPPVASMNDFTPQEAALLQREIYMTTHSGGQHDY